MSQVIVATTTPSMSVMCFRAITVTASLVPTAVDLSALGQHDVHISVDLAASDQHDVVLSPQLILKYTMRGSFCLTTVPQQQQPQSQMPSQAYANYIWVLLR